MVWSCLDFNRTIRASVGPSCPTLIVYRPGASGSFHASIMILGESGSGKTQLATAFARASSQQPIVRAKLGGQGIQVNNESQNRETRR